MQSISALYRGRQLSYALKRTIAAQSNSVIYKRFRCSHAMRRMFAQANTRTHEHVNTWRDKKTRRESGYNILQSNKWWTQKDMSMKWCMDNAYLTSKAAQSTGAYCQQQQRRQQQWRRRWRARPNALLTTSVIINFIFNCLKATTSNNNNNNNDKARKAKSDALSQPLWALLQCA